MIGTKMEIKTIWILVLLVYSKASGGEFYDTNNSVSINGNPAEDNNLHSIAANRELNDNDEPYSNNHVNGLHRTEANFLAKLRQSQRQGQIFPTMDMPLRSQPKLQSPPEMGSDTDWQYLLLELLSNPNNEDSSYRSLEEDLGTIMRFLAQQKEFQRVEEANYPPSSSGGGDLSQMPGQKRAAALRTSMARRSHTFPYSKERFSPSISVGALTNLGDFFQHLRNNLESLESKNLSKDQVKLLEGENMISNLRKEFTVDYPKPAGSAAFLHAYRNYRPSNGIRALVSSVPELYRGTNYHDPVYKLAGLGK